MNKPVTINYERLCTDFLCSLDPPVVCDLDIRQRTYTIQSPKNSNWIMKRAYNDIEV